MSLSCIDSSCGSSCEERPLRLALRPIEAGDRELLFRIYASTREAERQLLDWAPAQWEAFLRQQFGFQHDQYMVAYQNPSFDLVLLEDEPVGRLYVDRRDDEIRVIDIALLEEFRCLGIGGRLLRTLIAEAETGGRFLGLHVEKNNPVLDFYRRLGFQEVVDRGVYLYMTRLPQHQGGAS